MMQEHLDSNSMYNASVLQNLLEGAASAAGSGGSKALEESTADLANSLSKYEIRYRVLDLLSDID